MIDIRLFSLIDMEINDFQAKELLNSGNDDFSTQELSSRFDSKTLCKSKSLAKNANNISYKENDVLNIDETESPSPLKQEKKAIEFEEKQTLEPSYTLTSYTLKNRRHYKYGKDIH